MQETDAVRPGDAKSPAEPSKLRVRPQTLMGLNPCHINPPDPVGVHIHPSEPPISGQSQIQRPSHWHGTSRPTPGNVALFSCAKSRSTDSLLRLWHQERDHPRCNPCRRPSNSGWKLED